MAKKHVVELTDEQRESLDRLVNSGRESARKITRARVLLKADQGEADEAIAEALGVSVATTERVRKRFATSGLDGAVERRPQPPRPHKRVLDGDAEARLTTLACSKNLSGKPLEPRVRPCQCRFPGFGGTSRIDTKPPDGYGRWTLDLLADRLVRLNVVPAVSADTVGRCLKKAKSSRG